MGEIVAARSLSTRSVLLVGQAPGSAGDTRPLSGTMGVKLADLAGLALATSESVEQDERAGLFWDRANVLDYYPGRAGKGHAFPPGAALASAIKMFERVCGYDRVLFCGKAVYDAFRRASRLRAVQLQDDPAHPYGLWPRDLPKLTWVQLQTEMAWMPHTSLVVPWWNHPGNEKAAERFLSDLLVWTVS